MTNPFYTASGNPTTGAEGLSALMRAEFLAIEGGFNILPRITTTGLFDTIFTQIGSFTFVLPNHAGMLALTSDVTFNVGVETAARIAADTAETTRALAAEAAQTAARVAGDVAEQARALAAEGVLATAVATKQATLGFTPVQQGTGFNQLQNVVKIGWTGAALAVSVDASNQGLFVTTNNPNGFATDASVTVERNRAIATEGALSTAIATEGNTRATQVTVEADRAKAVEAALTGSIAGKQPLLGFTAVRQGYNGNTVVLGWNGSGLACTVDVSDQGYVVTTANPHGFALSSEIPAALTPYVKNPWTPNPTFLGWYQGVLSAQVDNTYFGQVPTQYFPGNFMRNGDTIYPALVSSVGAVYANATVTNSGFFLQGSANGRALNWAADGWKLLFNSATGTLGQYSNTGAGLLTLDASGNLGVPGTISGANVSDVRTKRAIVPFRRGLHAILGLIPISYEYNGEGGTVDTGTKRWGVSAQQAQEWLPEAVYETPEPGVDPEIAFTPAKVRLAGQLSFDEQPLLYAMVNAFHDMADELAVVKARLARLEAR